MSEQRKARAELRQGLHQFLMQLYFSYTESMGKQEATKAVQDVLTEQYQYFGAQVPEEASSGKDLSVLAKELEKRARASQSQEEQMYLYEKVETLMRAIEIIEEG